MNHPDHATPRIAASCNPLAVFAIALALAAFGGCKKPTLPNSISTDQVAKIASASAAEARDVRFGGRFILLGVGATMTADGLHLELAWKSESKERLHCHVAIHAVDEGGKILAQADYEQAGGDVQPGMIWRDAVTLPREQLRGATAIAIGLMEAGDKWLAADRGPRDWEDRRLLVPLAEKIPPAIPPSPFEGFIEAVNTKQIVGWAWNKEQPATAVEVEILDGDRVIAKAAADVAREDLRKNKIGDGGHGFAIPTPAQLLEGASHSVHVRVAGTSVELTNSPRTFALPKK